MSQQPTDAEAQAAAFLAAQNITGDVELHAAGEQASVVVPD
ncbi:hypothetical protein [Nocardioides euryhalodurans]|nr:hypothetical protein [Nocardioides euryhalodurans]